MSLDATRWALEQRVGSGSAKAVLFVMADKANKKTGRIFANAETIAHGAEVHENSVWAYWQRWTKRGILIDTGERGGKNGRTPVFIWSGFSAAKAATAHTLTTDSPQSDHSLTTASVASFIGESVSNREPGTVNPDGLGEKGRWDSSLAEGDNDLSHSQKKKVLPFSPEPAALPEWVEDIQEMPEFAKRNVEKEARKIKTSAEKNGKPFTKQYVINVLRKHQPFAKTKPPRIEKTCKTPDEQPTDDVTRAKLIAAAKKDIEALSKQFAFK